MAKLLHLELANGLTILGEANPQADSAAVGFFVRTGARDELPIESGVSHFLEHMVFKGTNNRSALDITFEMGNIGAQANAYTSEESTVYYSAVLPEFVPNVSAILADMLAPAIDPNEFETERKVILEEIAQYQDRPHYYLFEHALRDYFFDHPAGNSVLGTTESIAALEARQMVDYHQRRYSADNIIAVASGRIDWEVFCKQVALLCGSIRSNTAKRVSAPWPAQDRRAQYQRDNIHQAHLVIATEGASAQDPLRDALGVLAVILGDGSGSKLYWRLVDSGIAETAVIETDERDGTGVLMSYATCEPEDIEQVSSAIEDVLSSPLDFTDQDLERAKTKIAAREVLSSELPMPRLMALGNEWMYRGEVTPLEKTVEKIRALTRADIERALERFPLKVRSRYALLPK